MPDSCFSQAPPVMGNYCAPDTTWALRVPRWEQNVVPTPAGGWSHRWPLPFKRHYHPLPLYLLEHGHTSFRRPCLHFLCPAPPLPSLSTILPNLPSPIQPLPSPLPSWLLPLPPVLSLEFIGLAHSLQAPPPLVPPPPYKTLPPSLSFSSSFFPSVMYCYCCLLGSASLVGCLVLPRRVALCAPRIGVEARGCSRGSGQPGFLP